jgi:hypothetical protein
VPFRFFKSGLHARNQTIGNKLAQHVSRANLFTYEVKTSLCSGRDKIRFPAPHDQETPESSSSKQKE